MIIITMIIKAIIIKRTRTTTTTTTRNALDREAYQPPMPSIRNDHTLRLSTHRHMVIIKN